MGGTEVAHGVRSRRRVSGFRRVAVLASLVVAAACEPGLVPTHDGAGTSPLVSAPLSPDGGDVVAMTRTGADLELAAPATNTGENLRVAFWPTDSPIVADSRACVTWTAQEGGYAQQGLAFRIRSANGRVRAVTVTKNVVYGFVWVFNVHTWDSDRSPANRQVGQVTASGLVEGGELAPLPWRLCGRVVGDVVDLKVWAGATPEPEWGDQRWGGRVTLPGGWSAAGATGWYVGHLHPGDRTTYTDLRTWRYE